MSSRVRGCEPLEPRRPLDGAAALELQAEAPSRSQPGNGHQWSIVDAQTAAGSFSGATGPEQQFLQLLTSAGQDSPYGSVAAPAAPFVEFELQVAASGPYDLKLRVAGTSSASDSLWAEIATGALADSQGNLAVGQALRVETNATGAFELRSAGRWNLAAGAHTLRLAMRESGVAVDSLVLAPALVVPPTGSLEIPAEGFARRSEGSGHRWWLVDRETPGVGNLTGSPPTATGYLQLLTLAGQDSPQGSVAVPNAPAVEYDLQVSAAGSYGLQLSVTGLSSASDSLWVEVPTGGLQDPAGNVAAGGALRIETNASGQFEWRDAGLWQLAPGTHRIRVSMRESGVALAALRVTAGDATPPTLDLVDVAPDPRNAPVDAIDLVFSEPITGLDRGDLLLDLYLDGKGTLLTPDQTLTTSDNRTWTLHGLAPITAAPGLYTLSLAAATSGIRDLAGNLLAKNAAERWTVDLVAPTVRLETVYPDPRATGVASLAAVFSEPVRGLRTDHLALTRNGGAPLPVASVSTADGRIWTIAGIDELDDGDYSLELTASAEIVDAAGNPLLTGATTTWQLDRTPPTVSVGGVEPALRTTPIDAVTIVLGEPAPFDLSRITLLVDGLAVAWTEQSLSSADGLTWSLQGLASLTAAAGHYQLVATAADALGNLGAGSVNWVVDLAPPVASLPAVPSPRNSAVNSLAIDFDEGVTGFDLADVSLQRDGGPNLLTESQTLTQAGLRWTLGGLSGLTSLSGTYRLTLTAAGSGIVDLVGRALETDASASWVVDTLAPTVDIIDVAPDPRTVAADQLEIFFSEPVRGFDLADLLLDLEGDGLGNLLTAAQTLTTTDGQRWTVGNLAPLQSAPGRYTLSLKNSGTGIADLAGNALVGATYDQWTIDVAPPTVDVVDVAPDPRSSWASPLLIVFSEKVTGFDLGDLSLTRDGGPNLLTSAQTFASNDQKTWYLGNLSSLTAPEGVYTLTLNAATAGIVDLAGNPLATGADETWTVATYLYVTVGDLRIAFDPRYNYFPAKLERGGLPLMDYDGSTNGAVISLAGVGFVGGQHGHETLEAISFVVDGVPQPVAGAGIFSAQAATLTRTTVLGGAYRLTHTLSISADGIDDHVSLAGLDATKIVDKFYAFLGSRNNRLTSWTAYGQSGEELAHGETTSEAGTTYLPVGTWKVEQYDLQMHDGVLTEWDVPDLMPSAFIVDRSTDNKLYLDLLGLYGPADKQLEFSHRLRFTSGD